MYVATVPNRTSPPAILLRENFREDGKTKTRTLANLSKWSPAKVARLQAVLKDEPLVNADAMQVTRSLPHGHVAAVQGVLRRLGVHTMLGARRTRERDLVEAMIVARVLDPRSKLATARGLDPSTGQSSLGEDLSLGGVEVHELYAALDWLFERQTDVEKSLAAKHLKEGGLALYDLSAAHFEGRKCPLAKLGHPRGSIKGKLQVNFGLLCDAEGRPVSVQVYEGNQADPGTVPDQVAKVKDQFGLETVVFVGDRGMLTSARIRDNLEPNGMSWVTSLRAPQVQQLAEDGAFQLSLFDQQDLAEVTHPDYPGERLVVCKNPLLAEERARKRRELLDATEKRLLVIQTATQRKNRPLRGKDKIGIRVGRILDRSKVGKHFNYVIGDDSLTFERDQDRIKKEADLDGIYVIRTNVGSDKLESEQVVVTYKQLQNVERAFRSFKTIDLHVRPIHHRLEGRVRAHIFLCMLAYYVEWHMRRDLAPILFDDHDKPGAAAKRKSIVDPAERSDAALAKAARKMTEDGLPVHSFRTLLQDLATIARTTARWDAADLELVRVTTPTPVQARALKLLDITP